MSTATEVFSNDQEHADPQSAVEGLTRTNSASKTNEVSTQTENLSGSESFNEFCRQIIDDEICLIQ